MKITQPRKLANRPWVRVVYIFLVLVLCFSLAPQKEAQAATCKFKHKVKAGETLIYISQLYQYDWKEIAKANDLKEPYTLTVGQSLCIPGGTKPDSTTTTTTTTGTTTTTKKQPTVTVSSGPNSVYLKLANFPKHMVYYVRVYSASGEGIVPPGAPPAPTDEVEYKIGRARTDKNGAFEDWFRIPAYVPEARYMILCLKNAWTDESACVKYEHPWYNLYPVIIPGVKKGR